MAKKKGMLEQWLSEDLSGLLRPPGDEVAPEPPEYDSPEGSVWIVAVDIAGNVTVLETPNIHESFTDNGPAAQDLGLPEQVDDLDPGIYRWTCSYHTSVDWESGHVDDWHFEVEKEELLWSPDNP